LAISFIELFDSPDQSDSSSYVICVTVAAKEICTLNKTHFVEVHI